MSWCDHWESRPLHDAHFEPYEVIDMIKSGHTSCRKTDIGIRVLQGYLVTAGSSGLLNSAISHLLGSCTEFDLAKNHTNKIRDLIVTKAPGKSPNLNVNFATDLPLHTSNFDLAFRCTKKARIPSPFHLYPYWLDDVIPITTDYWIAMNFQTEEPKEVTKCCPDGGERQYVAGEPDGTESFCV